MQNKSTYLGNVQDVKGITVAVTLTNESLSGLVYVDGEGYKIGQVGSFVKIPLGYIDLFGIVTQVGASSVPENQLVNQPYGNRWFTVQLMGEGQRNGNFERGISQYPTIADEVHLVSEADLKRIYDVPDRPYFVKIGNIAGAESIPALIDINKLLTRHSAIVGTTGAGKSTTVARLVDALSDNSRYPSSRIIILDIHGEYGKAFKNSSKIYKINADRDANNNENELYIPFWALNFDELLQVTFGDFSSEKDKGAVIEKIIKYKELAFDKYSKNGVLKDMLNVDTPIPFSLHQLWYDLWNETCFTYYSANGQKPEQINWAYEKDAQGKDIIGDPLKAIPPRFKQVKNVKDDTEKINYGPSELNIRSQLEALGSRLRLPRYNFLFRPGDWMPELDGRVESDLDILFKEWIGSDKPVTILDLSGVPIDILNTVIGVLLRIIYEGLFWARHLSQGGRYRPLLIVMEEAHNYLNDDFKGIASRVVQRIVKEGRKYGIGAMIGSQRPSEISPTILSQCGTFFAMRLANSIDRSHITSSLTDNLEGLTNMLPILKTGETIILGESVKLPMRAIIQQPPFDKRPDSQDPVVYDEKPSEESYNPGGWGIPMETNPNYSEFVEVWRAQNPLPQRTIKK